MSIRVKVIKYDGTCDEWGNVLGLHYNAADHVLRVHHGDGNSRAHTKDYYSGQYKDVEITQGPSDYELYPKENA